MLYAHLLFVFFAGLAAILLCGVAALAGMVALKLVTGFPSSNMGYALVTAAFCLPLVYLSYPGWLRLLAKNVPGKCPGCKTWAAKLLFTHPIGYHCAACGKLSKLKIFLEGGLYQDCPKCEGEGTFRPTDSRQRIGPNKLLCYRCSKCGHFDYCEEPPMGGG